MGFDESKIKRHPKGDDKGGEFAPKHGAGTGRPSRGGPPPDGKYTGITYDMKSKQWVDRNKKPLDKKALAQLQKIKGLTPGGYSSVSLNPDFNAGLMAWVTSKTLSPDDKNYVKRLYSTEHQHSASAAKHSRLRDFNSDLPAIKAGVEQRMLNKGLNDRQRDTAAALRVVELTGLRPGSDEGETSVREKGKIIGSVKTYGVSTMLGSHIKLGAGGKIEINFTGKAGKLNSRSFVDPKLSKYLSQKNLKPNEPVFNTSGDYMNVMLKSISGRPYKVKDFRTWQGTTLALKTIRGMAAPTNEAEYKAAVKLVSTKVSDFLNNTPDVAFNNYIDPYVFDGWRIKKGKS